MTRVRGNPTAVLWKKKGVTCTSTGTCTLFPLKAISQKNLGVISRLVKLHAAAPTLALWTVKQDGEQLHDCKADLKLFFH